jgi:uncharacterized repeat protein (TIGR01451 family)/MYXO-CTERM domain-containing protein
MRTGRPIGKIKRKSKANALLRQWICLLGLLTCFLPLGAAGQTVTPISVVYSATPDPVVAGGTIVFTINLANPTNTPTAAFTVTSTIPQSMTVTYAPGGGCNGSCRFGGTLSWAVGALAAGASTFVTYTATIDNSTTNPPPAVGTTLTAQASVMVGGTTVSATANVIVGTSNMSLGVLTPSTRPSPGAPFTLTLDYGNTGSSSQAALLAVPVPAGTTFVSATGGGTQSNGTVQWDLGTVAPGFADKRQVTFAVGGSVAVGTLLATQAQILDASSQQSLIRATAVTAVATTTPLSLEVWATPDPVQAGNTVVYTIRIANGSTNTPTSAFTLYATIPQSMTVTYAPGGGCNSQCRFGGLLSWSIASLAPGESTWLLYTATVDNSMTNPPPPSGTILTNTFSAEVFGTVTASASVIVGNGSNLNLAVNAAPERVAPGASITYTLSFGNPGGSGVPATLNFPLPVGTTFESASGNGATEGSSVQWDLGTVAPGLADERQVTVMVDSGVTPGTLLVAQAELLATATQQTLVRATRTDLVATSAPLSIHMSASPDPVQPGQTVVYTIRVANESPNTPTSAFTLYSTIAPFMTVTYAPGGGCNSQCRFGGDLGWSIGSIAPGDSTTIVFTAVIDDSTTDPPPPNGTLLHNEAFTSVFGGVTAGETLVVGDGSHLNLSVTGTPDRVAAGSQLTYTFWFGNTGGATVPANLAFPLPTGTSFVSATSGGTESGGVVVWPLGPMPTGAGDTRQVTVAVDPNAQAGMLIDAEAQLVDPASGRMLVRQWAENLVVTQTLLGLTMTATPATATPGGTLQYQIVLTNESTNTPTGAFTLDATIPRFFTVTQAPGGGCNSQCRFGGLLSWSVGSLAPGATTTVTFTGTVDNSVADPPPPTGTVLVSTAMAFVFGTVQTQSDVFVGSVTSVPPGGFTTVGEDGGVLGAADASVGEPDATAPVEAGSGGQPDATVAAPDGGSNDGGALFADASATLSDASTAFADASATLADASTGTTVEDGGMSPSDAGTALADGSTAQPDASAASADGGNSGASSDAGMTATNGEDAGAGAGASTSTSGCSCSSAGSNGENAAPWLAIVAVVGLAARRRERRRAA